VSSIVVDGMPSSVATGGAASTSSGSVHRSGSLPLVSRIQNSDAGIPLTRPVAQPGSVTARYSTWRAIDRSGDVEASVCAAHSSGGGNSGGFDPL
jgi:hypothetical protein